MRLHRYSGRCSPTPLGDKGRIAVWAETDMLEVLPDMGVPSPKSVEG